MKLRRKYFYPSIITLLAIIACLTACLIIQKYCYQKEIALMENANILLISKQEMKLYLINYKGVELFSTSIACGKNSGNKKKVGDMKTPEGVFKVIDIQNASTWGHDFNDGHGEIKGAYGPYFIRLEVPGHTGIGIHGTHDPTSIRSRATEGCIRIENRKLEELVPLIQVPTTVIITPSITDVIENQNKQATKNVSKKRK